MALIVAAAIISEGRLLAARRCAGPLAGLWEFPGGKVEAGEDDHGALRRELQEELAVGGVAVGDRVGGEWPLDGGHCMHVYRVELSVGVAPALTTSHDALRWLDAAEVCSVPWIASDQPIVAAIRPELRGGEPR